MAQKKQFAQIDILGTNQTPMDAFIYTDEETGQSFEFYEVTLSGGKFYHKDEELNYAKLVEKFNDNKYFLYLKHLNLIFIPSIETDDALAFSVAWTRREEAGDYEYPQPYISRVIINTDEVVRSEQTGVQATDLMLDNYDDYEEQYGEKMYPSAKAVKDLVESSSPTSEVPAIQFDIEGYESIAFWGNDNKEPSPELMGGNQNRPEVRIFGVKKGDINAVLASDCFDLDQDGNGHQMYRFRRSYRQGYDNDIMKYICINFNSAPAGVDEAYDGTFSFEIYQIDLYNPEKYGRVFGYYRSFSFSSKLIPWWDI